MEFVGCDVDTQQRMEIMELRGHGYFVGCQYHPEYLTRPLKPSPPYLGLILAAKRHRDGEKEKVHEMQNVIDSLKGEREQLRSEVEDLLEEIRNYREEGIEIELT